MDSLISHLIQQLRIISVCSYVSRRIQPVVVWDLRVDSTDIITQNINHLIHLKRLKFEQCLY